jgi:DUF971 family protein
MMRRIQGPLAMPKGSKSTGGGASLPAAIVVAKVMTAPNELRVSRDRRLLTITFPGHAPAELSAELLRVVSPSAEVQGHSPQQRVTVPGKRNVAISDMIPTGNYAVRIVFDDGHDTGIFTWDYLHKMAHDKATMWQDYLAELAAKGLSRDR